ncbi:hypothetical protein [Rhizobium halophytocola]|uniref:DUF2188 domain-containing protein n=1 Tax=Rhizobium halophytocola TaxID=735519 RepID=A0ABS4DY52_9HYPH|nr:hypothetical protein [Rhizobium halophytocola]MBP1850627.1 hypothetical protein [Rhizobium halophytocola]
MRIVGTQVHEEMGGRGGYIVEFVSEDGDVASVQLRQTESRGLTRGNAVEKAKALLSSAAGYDPQTGDEDKAAAVKSARQSKDREEQESQLEEGLEDTFPASDPVSASYSSTAGKH